MYDYKAEMKNLGDSAHKALLTVALRAQALCEKAGAARMDKLMLAAGDAKVSDNWGQMAIVERLVELGVLREIPVSERVTMQFRMFAWMGV